MGTVPQPIRMFSRRWDSGFSVEPGDAFAIQPGTGTIFVHNPAKLNYEATKQFGLTVNVTDGGLPEKSTSVTITILLKDVNEAPEQVTYKISVNENSANGSFIGTVPVFDPDAGQSPDLCHYQREHQQCLQH